MLRSQRPERERFDRSLPGVKREQVIALLEEAREYAVSESKMRPPLDENLDW